MTAKDDVRLATNLRAARKAKGHTQVSLAAALGCSVSFITLLERGKRKPSLVFLDKLAKELSLTRGALLGDEEES